MKLKCNAIVLSGFPFGESHKVISFFTNSHGLLKAVAHGIRKPTSKFGSSLELLNNVELILNLSKKNDLHSIKEFALLNSRQNIRENNKDIGLNFYLAELLNELFKNAPPNKNVYDLVNKFLDNINPQNFYMLHRSLSFKILYLLGFINDFVTCSECGNESQILFISNLGGFIYCENCRNSVSAQPLSKGTVLILQKMISSEINELDRIRLSDSQKREIDDSLNFIIKGILGKSLKSENFLSLI